MIYKKLMNIQTEIKAPKNMHNSFGNYNYRNAESICEAVKPFLKEQGCSLITTDEVMSIGDRVYVKATARLVDNENGEKVEVSAYAREALAKKGMDDSQVTGATSSYARKYALNGLFLLDDTKDPDTDEYAKQTEEKSGTKDTKHGITVEQVEQVKAEIERTGIDPGVILNMFGVNSYNEMTQVQFTACMNKFRKTPDKAV